MVAVVGVPEEVGAAETCAVETGIIAPGATPGSIGGALQEISSKLRHYLSKAQSIYAGLSGKKNNVGYKKPLPIWQCGLFNPCRTVD